MIGLISRVNGARVYGRVITVIRPFLYKNNALMGVARGGGMGECPPSWIERKFLAPELQTDDCFATSVTRQTLLII